MIYNHHKKVVLNFSVKSYTPILPENPNIFCQFAEYNWDTMRGTLTMH